MIETPRSSSHLPSLFLVLISGFGVVVGLLGAIILGLMTFSQPSQRLEMSVVTWIAVLIVLLNLPALIYSLPRMIGRPAPRWKINNGWRLASIALGVWVVDLAVASFLSDHPSGLTSALLPPLSLIAVGIPIWWLIELGRRGLRSSPQRTWGTVSATLLGTLPLTVIVELVAFVLLGILILVWLVGSSPDLLNQLQKLEGSLTNGNVGPENLIAIIQPYLQNPGVIAAGLLVLSVLTPLIEEFLKPLALWFIPGRRLTEAEGFTLGLVAGGIFALFETLGSLSGLTGRSDLWLTLVLVRVGTGLLHITCSGLVGWGLAAAWGRARYLQLAGLYLLAVFIHGTWNLFAELLTLGGLLPDNSPVSLVGRAAPFIMVVMAVLIFLLLLRINRHLNVLQVGISVLATPGDQPPAEGSLLVPADQPPYPGPAESETPPYPDLPSQTGPETTPGPDSDPSLQR